MHDYLYNLDINNFNKKAFNFMKNINKKVSKYSQYFNQIADNFNNHYIKKKI